MFIFLSFVILSQAVIIPFGLRSLIQFRRAPEVLLPTQPSPFAFDFKAADSRAVLAATFSQYYEIKDWEPSKGFKVIVGGGMYYEFILTDTMTKKSAAFSAYRINGVTSIVLMDFLFNLTLPIDYGGAWINPFPPSIDGFNAFTQYDNSSFITALRQSMDQNPKIRHYHLSQTEIFGSQQFFYFRFVFQQVPSSQKDVELIQCLLKPAVPTYDLGTYITLNLNTNNNLYRDFYEEVIAAYPQFAKYKIVSVRKQVTFQDNFEFVLLDSTPPIVKHVVLVSANLFGDHNVNVLRRDYSVGYSVEAIEAVCFNAVAKWPELANYTLTKSGNIRSDSTGLRLIFENEGDSRIVQFDLKSKKETLTISSA